MSSRLSRSAIAVVGAWAALGMSRASAVTLDAVEYYNAALDHYFVTALADEIAKLDAGVFVGWKRTSLSFKVFDPATPVAGASPVCRFYGLPSAGLDSHFYSASPAECADVMRRFPGIWELETNDAFGMWLPDPQTGQCPASSVPVYRSWNNRVDSNHRFTTDPAVQQAMIARGYIAEGYGTPMPVAMCSPTAGGPGPGAVPSCVVSSSDLTPYVGGGIVLTAACSNAPATFSWIGCDSAASQCNATSPAVGPVTYSVVAFNAAGSSAPASVDVAWQPLPAPPRCALARTSQTDPPAANGLLVLEANCDSTVGSYSWSGCSSTTNICVVRETSAGTRTYSVLARNAGGASAPAALTLNWVSSAPPPPGRCGQFPSYLFSDVGPESVRVESALLNIPPGFAWNGAWAVRFVVPSTMPLSRLGRLSAAEFAGEPTVRDATISATACDFRPTDPSGATGPFARASGVSTTNWFTIDPTRPGYPVLQPGGTYYYNLRNFRSSDNTITCPSSSLRCDAFVESLLPR